MYYKKEHQENPNGIDGEEVILMSKGVFFLFPKSSLTHPFFKKNYAFIRHFLITCTGSELDLSTWDSGIRLGSPEN